MKTIIYYLLLLVLLALTAGYTFFRPMDSMSMPQMFSVSGVLIIYTIAVSLVGESNSLDERELLHRNLSNRHALIAGTIVFSAGLIYQMFVTHVVDYWLLGGLIILNLTKIISLIYLETRK